MITLFNTYTRKREEFKPLQEKQVGLYTCGPTVYNYAHIGNLRTYVFEDLLKRMFLYNNFEVKHVMNITDVGHLTSDADEGEDKMEKGARREGKTVWEIADFYTEAFFNDLKKLNIIPPDEKPKATQHIQEMIGIIKKLEENGFTYEANGNVYFDVSKFENYGKLANLKLEDQKAGARVKEDEGKKNHFDFVLWFTKSKFKNHEMKWDSPWGKGYPGWHIECSAMSMKYFGETFDIHCGGIDHIPIHHTNEIAQSEGATGKKWVNYWVHGEFLVLDKDKMAKSAGNFLTLKTIIEKGFEPLDYRYFLLNAHYRKQLTFSWKALEGAKNALEGLKRKILEFKKIQDTEEEKTHEERQEEYEEKFLEAINDDLNIPEALAVLWNIIKDNKLTAKEKLHLIFMFDKIFGLGLEDVKEQKFDIPDDVMELIGKREQARMENNFKLADELRENIKKKGYMISDTKEGPDVTKIK